MDFNNYFKDMQMLFEHFLQKKKSPYTCCYLTWAKFLTAHLIENLKHNIEADENHIIYQLLNVVPLVKSWEDTSDAFKINALAPQDDCVSANQLKSAPITCTELLDHACLQLTRSTPQCTLRTQLFNYSIRWQYWQGKTYTTI